MPAGLRYLRRLTQERSIRTCGCALVACCSSPLHENATISRRLMRALVGGRLALRGPGWVGSGTEHRPEQRPLARLPESGPRQRPPGVGSRSQPPARKLPEAVPPIGSTHARVSGGPRSARGRVSNDLIAVASLATKRNVRNDLGWYRLPGSSGRPPEPQSRPF